MKAHTLAVLALSLAGLTTLGSAGCSDDDDNKGSTTSSGGHKSPYPTCDAVIKACHEFDTGAAGTIADCHSNAHGATSDEACVPFKDSCLAACAAAAEDAGVDGG